MKNICRINCFFYFCENKTEIDIGEQYKEAFHVWMEKNFCDEINVAFVNVPDSNWN